MISKQFWGCLLPGFRIYLMMKLSKFSCQGVPLLKDGCINTKVDAKAVLEKMGEIQEKEKRPGISGCDNKSYTPKTL